MYVAPNFCVSRYPLGGTEGSLETVGFNKTTESAMMNKHECRMDMYEFETDGAATVKP